MVGEGNKSGNILSSKMMKVNTFSAFIHISYNSIVLAHFERHECRKFDGKTLKFTRRLFHKTHKRAAEKVSEKENLCSLIPRT